ncbi:hypothetical protein NA57DRAFT_78498 [Rhizodiscina lignyota]|uniref:Rhodopsin domain-containing protein n=1 Tax=Rhizodiscina lignyota TaxID=1504668 RepID=A0A9P4ICL9_9PEZI|nr:hypothetical protein NA57DRAFT_78498 [Rhizodiscina lignyota]
MAIAVLPLAGRAVCIGLYSFIVDKPSASSAEEMTALKLLIPGRLTYAGFEWCLKLCILSFYFRITDESTYMSRGLRITFWSIVLTFVGIILATVLECRPLSMFWQYDPKRAIPCQKGLANLLTMAISNILTDVALIALPIPMLYRMQLSPGKKLQLILLFSVGIFVIGVTIARLPLIFDNSVEQSSRSMWASIEMATSCIVANFAFYYALLKDLRDGHSNSAATMSAAAAFSSISSGRSPSRPNNPEPASKKTRRTSDKILLMDVKR